MSVRLNVWKPNSPMNTLRCDEMKGGLQNIEPGIVSLQYLMLPFKLQIFSQNRRRMMEFPGLKSKVQMLFRFQWMADTVQYIIAINRRVFGFPKSKGYSSDSAYMRIESILLMYSSDPKLTVKFPCRVSMRIPRDNCTLHNPTKIQISSEKYAFSDRFPRFP